MIFKNIFYPYFKNKDDVIVNSISAFLNRVKQGEKAQKQFVTITNATYLIFDIKFSTKV